MTHWTNDHKSWYHTVYLKSDHWKELKSRKLQESPKCEKCGNSNCLDAHHVNYKQLFDVLTSDLLTLCRKCHKETHRINGFPKRSRKPLYKSQRDFTPAAKQYIQSVNKPKLSRLELRIQKLKDNGEPIPNHLLHRQKFLTELSYDGQFKNNKRPKSKRNHIWLTPDYGQPVIVKI